MFAYGFKEAAATNIVCDLPGSTYQVHVPRRWNDGSVKHAVIAGVATLTQGTPLVLTVSAGTPPTGTDLTHADIVTAAPTAVVDCGSFGSVSLSSLLAGGAFRTLYSGPQMVECHYVSAVGADANLLAWFHVRLFADGRMWIRPSAEHAYLDNGSGALASTSTKSFTGSLSVGGVTVYNNGGSTINLGSHQSFGGPEHFDGGWIGVDPQITVTYDVEYLRATKLVPNYGWLNPSEATLIAQSQTYTPMRNGNWSAYMPGVGGQPQIGLLPQWDARFCTSGDSRALKSVLANSSHLRSYGIMYRSKTTKEMIKPSSFGTWSALGPGGGGVPAMVTTSSTGATLTWENAHHGSGGYLAYLLTGDYWHYETMAANAAACYLSVNNAVGNGTSKFLLQQVRGQAWMKRTIGQYAAIGRTDDAVADDYRALTQYQYEALKTWVDHPTSTSQLGWLYGVAGDYPTNGFWHAVWQFAFEVAVNGYVWDMQPFSDATQIARLEAVRNFNYKQPLGLFSAGHWQRGGGQVAQKLGPTGVTATTVFRRTDCYDSWDDVFLANFLTTTISGNNLLAQNGTVDGVNCNPSQAEGGNQWGEHLASLAYAVDHGATGAQACWNNIIGADNWATLRDAGFENEPIFGIVPRNYTVS
jgi:hypothetical protein